MPNIVTSFYERMGLNAYVQGDYAKAEAWFRKLESREPDSLRVLRNLGVILLARGDAEGAEAYLLREERAYGPSFHRHAALADLAYARGRREEAARRYSAALAEPEAGGAPTAALIEARARICRDEKAFSRSRDSLSRFAEGEEARGGGDLARAVSLFDEAAALDPTAWPALNNAGTLLLNDLGDPDGAKARFERALALSRAPQVARNLELAEGALERERYRSLKAAAAEEAGKGGRGAAGAGKGGKDGKGGKPARAGGEGR